VLILFYARYLATVNLKDEVTDSEEQVQETQDEDTTADGDE
jgi:hypothetical protein